jgi:hypothetical protein
MGVTRKCSKQKLALDRDILDHHFGIQRHVPGTIAAAWR